MKEQMEKLKQEVIAKIDEATDLKEVNELKVIYMGKKGPVNELTSHMKELSVEEKKEFGMALNSLKQELGDKFDSTIKKYEEEALNAKLASEQIDITLPGTKINCGSPSILEKVIEEVEEVFMSMGYDVVDGPEVELDKFNFELLNIPKGHAARDAQDTFYLKDDEILLRSQTSGVQARVMLKHEGKEPIRMICPGKTYRRDSDDATHSHQFMQIEGLLVEQDPISLCDLKGTFEEAAKKLFGADTETRFRPSYYQFTEPSVEMDISCFACKGKGCSLCKNTGWITVGGAGMVHPNVLNMCGYPADKWNGFAFGFGAERLAMLKYGINDIRTFYNVDLREVNNFDRRDSE